MMAYPDIFIYPEGKPHLGKHFHPNVWLAVVFAACEELMNPRNVNHPELAPNPEDFK